MIKKVFLLICLCFPILGNAQIVDTHEFVPANDSLKGKLLFVTECHEVKTNLPEYLDLIKSITANYSGTDTLNVFIEAPFTISFFINQYLRGENRILVDSVFRNDPYKIEYYFAIRKLKKNIRFIACDFEYDHGAPGGRLEAYKMYFDDLKIQLEKSKIDLSVIKSFIYGIRMQGLDEADIFTFKKYINKLSINQPDAVLKAKLKEANFVLNALYTYDKNDIRDKATFSRINELIASGIDVTHNDNMMIYGSSHGNPYNDKCLYSKFQYATDSPFKSKVKLFANIYFECLSYGSYNQKSLVLESVGLYPDMKEDQTLLTQLKKDLPVDKPGSCLVFKNKLTSGQKDVDRVLYWAVHYKVK